MLEIVQTTISLQNTYYNNNEHGVKSLFFVLRYVPDRYKAQEICNKAILENGGKFESIPDQYKIQDMYDKTVDNHAQD